MHESIYEIYAPHFCVGLVVSHTGKVIRVPPIIKYMKGWHINEAKTYCNKKRWTLNKITRGENELGLQNSSS
jgi:hypothetical protein